MSVPPIPEAARAAWARGETIEAIRIVRVELGISLKQAKDLLESHGQQGRVPDARAAAPARPFPAAAMLALQQGDKLGAIRAVRQEHGLGLKAAHDVVKAYLAGRPQLQAGLLARRTDALRALILRLAIGAALAAALYLALPGV